MIIDDHEIVRRGIAEIVDRDDALEVVAEAGSVADAVRRADLVRPDVILVDLQLPDGTGIDIMNRLRSSHPQILPVVLTSFDDDEALAESLEAGARAYILKTVRGAEITDVIKAVADGRVLLDERTLTRRRVDHEDPTADLTPSERKVLDLIGDGLSNREIGEKLGVAEKTVKNHITSLLSKMGLQRRTQVAAWVAGQRAASWRNCATASFRKGRDEHERVGIIRPARLVCAPVVVFVLRVKLSINQGNPRFMRKLLSNWFMKKPYGVTFPSSSP